MAGSTRPLSKCRAVSAINSVLYRIMSNSCLSSGYCQVGGSRLAQLRPGRGREQVRHPRTPKAAADDDPVPSQQDGNAKSSLVSGRRLLLLAGAASMASAVPRWVVQTLDSQHHRKLKEDRIFSSFGASRAEAATLLDEVKVVRLTSTWQRHHSATES